MRIRAFQGLRPTPESASKIASLPYDVVNTAEARELAAGNPLSFLHVVRAEIDLPEGTDAYSQAVYDQAKTNLGSLQEQGGLVRETEPCLYLYRQKMGEHEQTGVVGVFRIEDYENNIIKKHEKTRKAKEDDRTALNRNLSAHPGPVFLTYNAEDDIDAIVDKITATEPFISFTAPDGVEHTIWRVAGGEDLIKAFEKVPVTYVADGHHRSASAARVGAERRAANPNHTGEEDYNWFLAVIFPGNQLNVLPYNRYVHDLNGRTPEQLIAEISKVCKVTANAPAEPAAYGQVSMYLDGKWYGLEFPGGESDPIARLDVSRLQDHVLAPLLDIDDPRTSEKIDFIGGIRGTQELVKLVDNGGGVAFSVYPVTVDQLIDIADADAIMPPKSTWFEPKLRSGLFIHTF